MGTGASVDSYSLIARALLCLFVLTGSFVRHSVAHDPSSAAQFRAACVKVAITPDSPQWLQGYGPRKSTGVHDPIYHRIAAMDDGQSAFFLVSTDICTISPGFYQTFCQRLERETDIASENVWWTTTHTHSAPHVGPQDLAKLFAGTLGDRFSMQHDTAYWTYVLDMLIRGLQEARSRLQPARLGFAIGEAEANVNRREKRNDGRVVLGVNPQGPVDRQLAVLRLERPDAVPIGLIANYAIHGTALGGGNTRITGDAPAIAAQHVERSLGVPMLFINGALGNVAPLHSVGSNLQDPRLLAYRALLGDRILELNATIAETTSSVDLAIGKTVVAIPQRVGLDWPAHLRQYASSSANGTRQIRVPIYSLIINDKTAVWAAPLELFSEIAMKIREKSPFDNTLYFGLTNGSLLYLPTEMAFAEGGYEPNVSPFAADAERTFRAGVIRYLHQLRRQASQH